MGAGPDVSAFVSQADKWVHRDLTMPIPDWARGAQWHNAAVAAAPVGYTPDVSRQRMVPVVSPGLPMVMAVFQRIGGRDGVFYVVPVMGALTVWVTFLLGRRMAGEAAGALAALFILCSPAFLWMLIQPMSDVPDAACWSAAVLCAWRPRRRDAVLAGMAAGAAILLRANTAPLAAVPALLLLSRPDARLTRITGFAMMTVPAVTFIAVLNARWHGSPFRSGYGTLDTLYSMTYLAQNIRSYGGWFVATQTPLAFLWLAAPYIVEQRRVERYRLALVSIVYPLAVFALYATYLTFNDWAFLRFLLLAYPAICASLATVFVTFAWQVNPRRLAVAAVIAVIASMVVEQGRYLAAAGILERQSENERFPRAVEFANGLPANTILISDAYSGTLRFYTGRDVLRWAAVLPAELDAVLAGLRTDGHPVYFIGDRFEELEFRKRFANSTTVRGFDTFRIPEGAYGFVAANLGAASGP